MIESSRTLTAALVICCLPQWMAVAVGDDDKLVWHELEPARVEGRGWTDVKRPFDRLPARAEELVRPPVWELVQNSSGMSFRFATNARSISARWTLTSDRLDMPHMPATGVSGVDLYVRRGERWHFLAGGRPTVFPTNEVQLIAGLEGQPTEYRLYLPLYNGVSQVAVGVAKDADFRVVEPAASKTRPIVFYGTSITQGGCASRPGMSYSSILGRRLNVPVINLGFSGNGKAEPEVAALLAELEAAALVIDPLPNLFAGDVETRMPKFLEIIRKARPDTPLLLVESPIYPDTSFAATRAERVKLSNNFLQQACEARRAAGDRRISVVPGCDLSADGGDGTVDGVHPTDLGFVRMADSIEPYLRAALE